MPRPSQLHDQRRRLLPVVADAFVELGYRRATTAELARRCGVQENILYRLWRDKKAMFIASIAFVFDSSLAIWEGLLSGAAADDRADRRAAARPRSPAELLLAYEAQHHGEFGRYRILFAALGETDDADIRRTLRETYARFHAWIARQVEQHRAGRGGGPAPILSAWALVGLGTVANIGRELELIDDGQRRALLEAAGPLLLDGASTPRRTRAKR